MNRNLGPLQALLDFDFREFITIKIIRILYVIAIVLSLIGALSFIGAGFQGGAFQGILAILVSPLIFLLLVLISRIYLEVLIVIFRIADNTRRIANAADSSQRDL